MVYEDIPKFIETVWLSLKQNSFVNLVFHSPGSLGEARGKGYLKAKGTVRTIGGRNVLQLETFFTEGRVTQQNIPIAKDDIDYLIQSQLNIFMKAELTDRDGTASLYRSKKGSFKYLKSGDPGRISYYEMQTRGNDTEKKHLLTGKEEFLFCLGISSREGRVHDKRQSKFRQICRFAEYIKEAEKKLPKDREIYVYDLCCGKSYLSFAAYYVLTEICGRKVSMYCVDLKRSVISYCEEVAEDSKMDGMHFICGDVLEYSPDTPVDMVISLHACDTATDEALARGVEWGCRYVVSAPCCQHELQKAIGPQSDAAFAGVLRHGILRERLCDILTDSFRAMILRILGFKTQVVEFVSPDATARNILLRAEYGVKPGQGGAVSDYLNLRDWWRVTPWLETRLSRLLEKHLSRY